MRAQKPQTLRQIMLFAALIAMTVYVASDAVRGPHGLVANRMLRAKIAAMKRDLGALKVQRARLERDAELLGPKAASQPDLLDEQARALLDFVRPTDIVIVNSDKGGRYASPTFAFACCTLESKCRNGPLVTVEYSGAYEFDI